jgi:glycosyltransferase involved in cell wall biosynthesis
VRSARIRQAAARTLLDDPALARRLGEAARERVLTAYSIERMIDRHAALNRDLVGA